MNNTALSLRYVLRNYENIVSISNGSNDFLINCNYNDSKLIKALDNMLDNVMSEIDFEIIKTLINFVKNRNILDKYLIKFISLYRERVRHIVRSGWPDRFYQIIKLLMINVKDVQLHQDKLVVFACLYAFSDLIELLIEKGIDLHNHEKAFEITVRYNFLNVAKIFVEKIPDICYKNFLLFHEIIKLENIQTIIFFVENGGNTDIFYNEPVVNILTEVLRFSFYNVQVDEVSRNNFLKIENYIKFKAIN